jgi:hypothetical protein
MAFVRSAPSLAFQTRLGRGRLRIDDEFQGGATTLRLPISKDLGGSCIVAQSCLLHGFESVKLTPSLSRANAYSAHRDTTG